MGHCLEKDSSHPAAHPLLVVHRVEHVDELVEVIGGLHDGTEEGHQSHIVTLSEELWTEAVRLQYGQPVREGANL